MTNAPDDPDRKTLHVHWSQFDNVAFIVSTATVRAARAADESPYLVDFGDLRRAGKVDELAERLADQYDTTIEQYVATIERVAGRRAIEGDVAARLAAVNDVDFSGDSTAEFDDEFPADDTTFRTEFEAEADPGAEGRDYDVISKAMGEDIPADLFEEYGEEVYGDTPGFSGHIESYVSASRLDALIAALEERGYTVVRDD